MINKRNTAIFYALSILFIALDSWFILKKQSGLVAVTPFAMIIIYLAVFSLDKLMLFVVFCTPFSINLGSVPDVFLEQIGVGAALPTEPIMFGILILFVMYLIYQGIDKQIINHPITLIILFALSWTVVTTVSSTMPIVSVKYFVERSWGIATFYFLGIYLFSKRKYIYTFMWMYIIPFTAIIAYTTIRHSRYHFSERGAHDAMSPFYNDHTAYGAILAMFIPVLIGLVINRARATTSRTIAFILLLVFICAIGLSFSRAAWVSLVVAAAVFMLMLFRIQLKTIFYSHLCGCCGSSVLPNKNNYAA